MGAPSPAAGPLATGDVVPLAPAPCDGTSGARGRRPVTELRRDTALQAVHDFAELIAASARSSVQRERIGRATGSPVTSASLAALRTIDHLGTPTVSAVARRLRLDQSTLSRQVRPLEDQGLVERRAAAGDRRAVRLRSTARGRRLLRRIRDVALNDYDVATGDWSEEDRALLGRLLERLRVDLLRNEVGDDGWSVAKAPGAVGDAVVGYWRLEPVPGTSR